MSSYLLAWTAFMHRCGIGACDDDLDMIRLLRFIAASPLCKHHWQVLCARTPNPNWPRYNFCRAIIHDKPKMRLHRYNIQPFYLHIQALGSIFPEHTRMPWQICFKLGLFSLQCWSSAIAVPFCVDMFGCLKSEDMFRIHLCRINSSVSHAFRIRMHILQNAACRSL